MDRKTREKLERQLARAVAYGDGVAVTILRARLGVELRPRRLPEMSELEQRYAWGDR